MSSTLQPSPSILIVDDDAAVREVLSTLLIDEGYLCTTAVDAVDALGQVMDGAIDLILSDLKMPGRDGLWLLDQLQRFRLDPAVIILTGLGAAESAAECLRLGASDFLLKPPRVSDLIRAIERALVRRGVEIAKRQYQRNLEEAVEEKITDLSPSAQGLRDTEAGTVAALVMAVDERLKRKKSGSSRREAHTAWVLAKKMGVEEPELTQIFYGALLHDMGMIGVPDSILFKPDPLTPAEMEIVRRHPEVGHEILARVSFLDEAARIVLSHQERWDGGGYPRGLSGKEIPLGARIFMVADAMEALLSGRPHRKPMTWSKARDEILRCAGTHFDPEVVRVFAEGTEEEFLLTEPTR